MTRHNLGRKSHTESGSILPFSWYLRRRVINVKCMVAAHCIIVKLLESTYPGNQAINHQRANTARHLHIPGSPLP